MLRPRNRPVSCAAVPRWPTVALVVLAAACSGGAPADNADQVVDAVETTSLPEQFEEFLALIVLGVDAEYSASYDAESADGSTQFLVSQRPPDRRVDVVGENGDLDSTILLGGTTYHCQRSSGEWACEALGDPAGVPTGLFDPDALEAAVKRLEDSQADYDFEFPSRTVANTETSCIVALPENPVDSAIFPGGTVCLSEDGVVLLLERPGESLEATRYETTVDDDSFTLPAAP